MLTLPGAIWLCIFSGDSKKKHLSLVQVFFCIVRWEPKLISSATRRISTVAIRLFSLSGPCTLWHVALELHPFISIRVPSIVTLLLSMVIKLNIFFCGGCCSDCLPFCPCHLIWWQRQSTGEFHIFFVVWLGLGLCDE